MKKFLIPIPKEVDNSSGSSKKQLCGKEDLVKILKHNFGYSEFRRKQFEAIEAVLSGNDCFCLMPTGGGKSMCYQIPALAKQGIVLVVCPLIALMENQVMALKEKGIAAEFLSSTQKSRVREKAHCISSWGHDFRPSYRNLSSLRNRLPDVPILALTATAVPKVQKDVMESLCLQHPLILRSSFNRPNIYYEVRFKELLDDVYLDLSNQLKSSGDTCSIVYCLERTTCDNVSSHLKNNGISCAAYHAGLNNKLRSSVLNDWLSSRIQVVVATVAFGMGIDRKDVRTVCHFNVPKSMEAFYQESGRAGRDQLPSKSLLYYGIDDRNKMAFILSNAGNKKLQSSVSQGDSSKKSLEDFNQMVEYCEGSCCRRKQILEFFGEKVPTSLCRKSCDACKHPNLVAKYLEELKCEHGVHGRSRIFRSSFSDTAAEDHFTEFWNHDEESVSEEDISDSDDCVEIARDMAMSKPSLKSGLEERLKFLEQAEENYYQTKIPNKQKNLDQKAVPEALREASKQRLLNALKQSQQRLGNIKIGLEPAVTSLENECYMKYGKIGKTFYNSQVASTVRWLSNSSCSEITERLGTGSNQGNDDCEAHSLTKDPSLSSSVPIDLDQGPMEEYKEEMHSSVGSKAHQSSLETKIISQHIELPPIPSFAEFVRKGDKEVGSNSSSTSTKRSTSLHSDTVKRKKL